MIFAFDNIIGDCWVSIYRDKLFITVQRTIASPIASVSFIVEISCLTYAYLNKVSYYNQENNLSVLEHENNFCLIILYVQ